VDEHGVEVTTIEFDDPWFLRLLEYPNPVGVRDFGGHPLKRSHPFPLTDEQIERLPEVPTTYFGEPAEDARTPQDRALPQPSTTPPMWAPNPARSKRDRRSPRRVK
jgi:hypothetical protein